MVRVPFVVALATLLSPVTCISFITGSAAHHRDPTRSVVRHRKGHGHGYDEEEQADAEAELERLEAKDPVPIRAHYEVSTAVECMVLLTCVWFAVYFAFFAVTVLNRLGLCHGANTERVLMSVSDTLWIVPMLCVLILACRMRAFQLTRGRAGQFHVPAWWIRLGMLACTFCVLLWTLIVVISRSLYGENWEVMAKTPRDPDAKFGAARALFRVQHVVHVIFYIGFTTVCIGMLTMQGPSELWGDAGGPPASPALICTIILTTTYFGIHLAVACLRFGTQAVAEGGDQRLNRLLDTLNQATSTLACVPMLCLLFMVARVRALQIDPLFGNPHWGIQIWFYVCTLGVIIQACLFIVEGYLLPDSAPPSGHVPAERTRSAGLGAHGQTLNKIKIGLNIMVHLSLIPIFVDMAWATTPSGDKAPPVTDGMLCVMLLQTMYFLVYGIALLLSLVQAGQSQCFSCGSRWQCPEPLSGVCPWCHVVVQRDVWASIELFVRVRAKQAVNFCPMFCILFIVLYLEVINIAGPYARPPDWAINLEYVVVCSIFLLALSRLDVALPRPRDIVKVICEVWQYVFLTILYLCAMCLSLCLYSMTGSEGTASLLSPVNGTTRLNFG